MPSSPRKGFQYGPQQELEGQVAEHDQQRAPHLSWIKANSTTGIAARIVPWWGRIVTKSQQSPKNRKIGTEKPEPGAGAGRGEAEDGFLMTR